MGLAKALLPAGTVRHSNEEKPMKRASYVISVLLILAGGLIAAGLINYPDTQSVLSVGDAALKVQTEKTVPAAVGYVLLAVGAIVGAAGLTLRRF